MAEMAFERLAFLAAFLVATACAALAQTVAVVPRDIVAVIYEREAAGLKDTKVETPFVSTSLRARYFSKAFDRLIRRGEADAVREQGVGPVDFDPVLSGQDGELKALRIETVRTEPGKTIVAAKFTSFGQAVTVTYDFIEENGSWKVDDIEGKREKEPWSVRHILEAARSQSR